MTTSNPQIRKASPMSELAVPESNNQIQQQSTVVEPAPMPSALMQWAMDARQAGLVAQSIAKTPFAGALRGKPEEVTAAILAGQELGLQPMATLRSIDVIQGQPALRAHAMRGLLQSKGHEIELVEANDNYCKMRGRRKGAETWQYVEWDIERAQRLGLLGKDQWKKQPKTMLIARATGEICRLVASDVLHGMPYAAEELDAAETVTAQAVGRAPRLTMATILRTEPPRAELEQASTEETTEPAADADDDVVDAEPVDEAVLLWEQIVAAGEARGWSAEQTERAFEAGSDGVPVAMAPIATLQAFMAHLQSGGVAA